MRVLTALRLASCFSGLAFFAGSSTVQAQPAGCADISRDVAAAVQKDTSKTLMIVEDALVINESCAGEIIKAAILASKADSALVNQIVQTGIAVAPKMSGVIMDSAVAVSPGAPPGVTAAEVATAAYDPTVSGKNPDQIAGKNPVEIAAKNPVEIYDKNPVEIYDKNPDKNPLPYVEDFIPIVGIRGLYLIQPPPAGFIIRVYKRKCRDIPTSPCYCTP